jgi:predicted membrane metal-binding protein
MINILFLASRLMVQGTACVLVLDYILGVVGALAAVVAALCLLYQAVGVWCTILSPVFVLLPFLCYGALLFWKWRNQEAEFSSIMTIPLTGEEISADSLVNGS